MKKRGERNPMDCGRTDVLVYIRACERWYLPSLSRTDSFSLSLFLSTSVRAQPRDSGARNGNQLLGRRPCYAGRRRVPNLLPIHPSFDSHSPSPSLSNALLLSFSLAHTACYRPGGCRRIYRWRRLCQIFMWSVDLRFMPAHLSATKEDSLSEARQSFISTAHSLSLSNFFSLLAICLYALF